MLDTAQEGKKPTRHDIDRFVESCISKGWTVRYRTHVKTRARWLVKKIKRRRQA